MLPLVIERVFCPLCVYILCRRLQQLRHEGGRIKQQSGELEALIARAATVMDQLASNCYL